MKTDSTPPPPSSYIVMKIHPTSPRLLCPQSYRRTGSASAVQYTADKAGERLGEASQCKTTGGVVRSQKDIYSLKFTYCEWGMFTSLAHHSNTFFSGWTWVPMKG